MVDSPRIAFVTTCKGRAQHIEKTLAQNLEDNADYPNAVFVIVNYNSPDHLLAHVGHTYRAEIEAGRVVLYTLMGAKGFKMAHAKNVAHRCGLLEGAEILVNLDADNYTGPGFAHYVAANYKPGRFMWARMIIGEMVRGISGRIVVGAQDFLKAGGYDEKFETWGPDDRDFNERLTRMGCEGFEIERFYLSGVRHTNRIRFREYPHANRGDDEDCINAKRETHRVVNFGRFGCGVVFRNFDFSPIELAPLPTRVFGIGLHKTGTSSLHAAFQTLGFDSWHWRNEREAKNIWSEMNAEGSSPTLEKYSALCDLPIPQLYRRLDKAYPGSKFILTVRAADTWIESMRRHYHAGTNPWKHKWNSDPFTHIIHRHIYGTKAFDAERMLAVYYAHNAEVQDYFRGRDDLLTMNAERGDGFFELCEFLKLPMPAASYPRHNVTKS